MEFTCPGYRLSVRVDRMRKPFGVFGESFYTTVISGTLFEDVVPVDEILSGRAQPKGALRALLFSQREERTR